MQTKVKDPKENTVSVVIDLNVEEMEEVIAPQGIVTPRFPMQPQRDAHRRRGRVERRRNGRSDHADVCPDRPDPRYQRGVTILRGFIDC